MSILKGERLVLIKEFGHLTVGETYEVANILEDSIVLREVRSKIAVGVVNIKDIDKYFMKPEVVRSWTPWTGFTVNDSGMTAFYRTNFKKVEVRYNGYKAAAYCNKVDDFDLYFGIDLAYRRCANKILANAIAESEKRITELEETKRFCESEMFDNRNYIKAMINRLEEKEI